VKSTPNVNDGESLMTTSFSADKVSQETPATNQRMTQSFYQTPAEHFVGGKSFNYSSLGGGHIDSSDYDRTEYDIDADATKSESFYAAKVPLNDLLADGRSQQTAALGFVDRNANSNSNIVTALDFSSHGEINNFFDHNDNMNGGAGTNGHGGGQQRIDSDTTHHQKIVSPHDIKLDDSFSSPSKTNRTFDDLINDNLSTPDGNVVGQTITTTTTTTKVVQERPLMDF